MSLWKFLATKLFAEDSDESKHVYAYDFGDTLAEMAEKFGEDTVFYAARGAFVISAQAKMKTWKTGKRHEATWGLSPVELERKLNSEWKPTYTPKGIVDPVKVVESLDTNFGRMTAAEQLAYMRQRMRALEAIAEAEAEAAEEAEIASETEEETEAEAEVVTLTKGGKKRR